MASQQLHVAQRATGVMGKSRRPRDESAAARVGRTAIETNESIGVGTLSGPALY
jgi:hypothetical protein